MQTHQQNPKETAAKTAPANEAKATRNPLQLLVPGTQEPVEKKRENHTGLPDNLKTGVENLSGYAMDDVKVHYNSAKPAGLNALAYAQGTEIHLGPGQEQHLPHEAWHVVQQKQGRVRPTVQAKGVEINDDKGLEREADVMGEKACKKEQSKPLFLEPHRSETAIQKVIQKTYDRTTGRYKNRPDAPRTFYPASPGQPPTQKAHKTPNKWIIDEINNAITLGESNATAGMELFRKIVAFSGKPFTFPNDFETELSKIPPVLRNTSFENAINALATQASWTEWNVRRTPLPEEREKLRGGDDPGSDDLDLNYTSSGHTTPRSFEAERIAISGGIAAVDPVALTQALNNLKDKGGNAVNKNDVVPYDSAPWETVGTRTLPPSRTLPARTLTTRRNKNNPEHWDSPFAQIQYPKQDDVITSDNYTLRIKVNSKTENVQVKIQKAGTDGEWVQARKDSNVWWFDWKNIGSGSYEIMAKAWDVTGKDWVSRKVNVHKN